MKALDFFNILTKDYNYNYFAVRRLVNKLFFINYEIDKEKELDDTLVNQILDKLNKNRDYPLEYIQGSVNFYRRDFVVSKKVLIPRNETEELIELIIKNYSNSNFHNVLDIGCGSGIIGITLGIELNLPTTLLDISDDALEISKINSINNGCKAQIIKSDFLKEIIKQNLKFDLIVSNPPYIGKDDEVGNETIYEPSLALFAEDDGLYPYFEILKNLNKVLLPKGIAFFETSSLHHDKYLKLEEIFKEFSFEFLKDSSSKWRFMIVKYK